MIKKTTENQSKRKLNQVHSMSERLKYRTIKDSDIRKAKSNYRQSVFFNIIVLIALFAMLYYHGISYNKLVKTVDLDNRIIAAKSDKISELGMDVADQETNNAFLSQRITALEMELGYYKEESERFKSDYDQLYDFAGRYMENDFGFLDIAKNVSESHTYDVFNYNCVDFSNDFVNMARESGYQARTFGVKVNCDSEMFSAACSAYGTNGHMIAVMSIPIEAITGKIISPSEYEDYGIDRDLL